MSNNLEEVGYWRKTAITDRELEKLDIDIASLSETGLTYRLSMQDAMFLLLAWRKQTRPL